MFLYSTLIWQSGYQVAADREITSNGSPTGKEHPHIWTRKCPRFAGKLKETFFSGAGCIKQLSLWQVVSWKAIRGVWQPPPHIKFFQPVNCTEHSAKPTVKSAKLTVHSAKLTVHGAQVHNTQCKTAQNTVQKSQCTTCSAKLQQHTWRSKTYHSAQLNVHSTWRARPKVHNAKFVSAQPQCSAAFFKRFCIADKLTLPSLLTLCTVHSSAQLTVDSTLCTVYCAQLTVHSTQSAQCQVR